MKRRRVENKRYAEQAVPTPAEKKKATADRLAHAQKNVLAMCHNGYKSDFSGRCANCRQWKSAHPILSITLVPSDVEVVIEALDKLASVRVGTNDIERIRAHFKIELRNLRKRFGLPADAPPEAQL